MKTIKWYRLSQWGNVREFVHPDNARDAVIIQGLTGRATITSVTRDYITALTGGQIQWQETIAP